MSSVHFRLPVSRNSVSVTRRYGGRRGEHRLSLGVSPTGLRLVVIWIAIAVFAAEYSTAQQVGAGPVPPGRTVEWDADGRPALPVSSSPEDSAADSRILPITGGGVVINEIMYHEDTASSDPNRSHEWVEIVNNDIEDLDLSGWVISDRDGAIGTGARSLPPVTLPSGSHLVVHFALGFGDLDFSDGRGDYFTNDGTVDLFDHVMDECGVYSSPSGVTTVSVDFIGWNEGSTGYQPGTAHDDAVAAGEWTAMSFLNSARIASNAGEKTRTVRIGTSIGRDKDSTDTDRPNDWDANGGRHALDITPGRQNFDSLNLAFFNAGPPPAPKEWTILIYMDGDNNLETNAFDDLKELEGAGGSDENINVVVMVDGQDNLVQVNVDATGSITRVFPETRGGAWRFYVGNHQWPRLVRLFTHGGADPFLGSPDPATPDDPNMGVPGTLANFIAWGKASYPADKYALILWDHGIGWQGFGEDNTPGAHNPDRPVAFDRHYMGELTAALGAHDFEMIGFDACLMAMIEVAHQIGDSCNYMVASEELEDVAGWPYDLWLRELRDNPGWTGAGLGMQIVEDFHTFYSAPPNQDDIHTLSCVKMERLRELVNAVSAFGADLTLGCEDFVIHDDPADNVEERISIQARDTERFDQQYMDIRHFVQRIRDDAKIPIGADQCYKVQIPTLIDLTAVPGPIVVAEEHGRLHPNANGISIYMPMTRWEYDRPEESRITDTASLRALYAPNNDALPFLANDPETNTVLAAPPDSPLTPSPGFKFPADTLWDEFLMRFYHPVADNHILYADYGEGRILPVIVDPPCGNPVDEITIWPGCTVYFSANGSSDADTSTTHWMWDFDHEERGCDVCIAPYEVGAGADGAGANDDMNADHDADKAPLDDEKQADTRNPSFTFMEIGDYIVTLHVWDENHGTPFHDTNPTDDHVHPQTDDHTSIVHVVEHLVPVADWRRHQ